MQRIWVGTSGFSYKEWKGTFYPADLPDRRMLEYYASRFKSVEIDSTFYRMPTSKTLEAWKASTPEDFRFTLKAGQQITHRERLRVPSAALDHWNSMVPLLESRLGLILYQLPPFFRCDLARLEAFLAALSPALPSAFEFRHESWFTPEVYTLLERYSIALCINDSDERTTPLELTAESTYVRLRRARYSTTEREDWRIRFRGWAEANVEVFAYIKHEDNPDAPAIALEFAEGL